LADRLKNSPSLRRNKDNFYWIIEIGHQHAANKGGIASCGERGDAIRNWKTTFNRFIIEFKDRLIDYE